MIERRSLVVILGAVLAALALLACSGADGDPAPAAVEAGAVDSGVVYVYLPCVDGAPE